MSKLHILKIVWKNYFITGAMPKKMGINSDSLIFKEKQVIQADRNLKVLKI
jgi:hypothetical protein